MNAFKKYIVMLLAVLILVSAMPTAVHADEGTGTDSVVDYILVVDTSGSTNDTDRERLCEEAARMFVNMVPLDNARVAVIAFGNEDRKNMYVFSGEYSQKVEHAERDRNLVHELVELQMTPDGATKEKIKAQVDALSSLAASAVENEDDSKTPIGLAVMAALDVLYKNKASDGNACIVLMTDGRITSHDNYIIDGNLLYNTKSNEYGEAVRIASSHNWPIYSIELNDDGENTASSDARIRLEAIAKKTGATYDVNGDGSISQDEKGTRVVSDMDDVLHTLMGIIARFTDGSTTYIVPDENGIATHDFSIEDMTSEKTIIVQSAVLDKVELLDERGNLVETFDKSVDMADRVVIRDYNHLCVKLICPKAGDYTLKVYGDAFAGVYVLEDSTFGMTLELHTDMVLQDVVLAKNEEIPFEAYFTYKDIPFRNNEFYTKSAPAVLSIVDNVTGEVVERQEMEAGYDGYFLRFPVSGLRDGGFTARVTVEDELFKGVPQISNGVVFATKEQDVKIKEGVVKVPDAEIKVGDSTWLRLSDYFINPDGSPVSYVLRGQGAELFEVQVEGDTMKITVPMTDCTYQIELVAEDRNMDKYPALPWEITVTDQKVMSEKQITMIKDAPQWMIDLADIKEPSKVEVEHLCLDPDGFPLEFLDCKVEDDSILELSGEEGDWTVRAVDYGSTSLNILVSDGIVDEFGQLVVTKVDIPVKVLRPGMLLVRKFLPFLVAFALAVLALVAYLAVRRAKTSFKDRWKVKVRIQNSSQYSTAYSVDLSYYNKKVDLKTLLEGDIVPFLPSAASAEINNVVDVWADTDAYTGVVFHAVPKDGGFRISKRSDLKICTVKNNDVEVKKSAYIAGGPLSIVFQQDEYMLEIILELDDDAEN